MDKKDDTLSIFKYLEFLRIPINETQFEKKIKNHPDYPSILSFYDALKDLDIQCQVLRIMAENISQLPENFIALIQDASEGVILVYIKKKKGEFVFQRNKKNIKLNENKLKNIWLGVVLLVESDKISGSIKYSYKDSDNSNQASIGFSLIEKVITLSNNDSIIGQNNQIVLGGIQEHLSFDIAGNNNKIVLKKNAKLFQTRLFFRGDNNYLEIGKNARVKGSFHLEGSNSSIKIGDETTIEFANISATESTKVNIGQDCMFSDSISIRTSDSHSIIDLKSNNRINPAADIEIKDHVWLGAGVTVLKGVKIGESSIIGSGAIVTKNILPNSMAAGIPAKVLRSNVNWNRELI
ncbi:cysteine peptidase family C39 domain-containing protein [uncultured Aquimarina sp.]|uniref:cysteine peptidase family C39 domain-containing protein n=1 Tax=uncultured Aquimarina sp. TaxID=575652 RepID=UPI00260B6522|nr:cysteine peptidase family C39 domain-containing protein [uncultured Aquimarina sp.]